MRKDVKNGPVSIFFFFFFPSEGEKGRTAYLALGMELAGALAAIVVICNDQALEARLESAGSHLGTTNTDDGVWGRGKQRAALLSLLGHHEY